MSEINYGGWDMHQDIYTRLNEKANHVDTALGNLLRDLHSKGLLDDTLIVLTTEFGRKPKLNVNGGRDHHPGAFCSLLAGAGIKGGQAYGASDKHGYSVDKDHVSISDFNKTIAAAAGLAAGRREVLAQRSTVQNRRRWRPGQRAAGLADLLPLAVEIVFVTSPRSRGRAVWSCR